LIEPQDQEDPTKITPEMKSIIEERMRKNDKTTSEDLHKLLLLKAGGSADSTHCFCMSSPNCNRNEEQFSYRLKTLANKMKRLQRARDNI